MEGPAGVREQLVVEDCGETDGEAGGRKTSRVRMSMLFVVLQRWRSPGLSTRVSLFQTLSQKHDWRD